MFGDQHARDGRDGKHGPSVFKVAFSECLAEPLRRAGASAMPVREAQTCGHIPSWVDTRVALPGMGPPPRAGLAERVAEHAEPFHLEFDDVAWLEGAVDPQRCPAVAGARAEEHARLEVLRLGS